jgi:hypothetical protein
MAQPGSCCIPVELEHAAVASAIGWQGDKQINTHLYCVNTHQAEGIAFWNFATYMAATAPFTPYAETTQ